jgi:hypothetical protein
MRGRVKGTPLTIVATNGEDDPIRTDENSRDRGVQWASMRHLRKLAGTEGLEPSVVFRLSGNSRVSLPIPLHANRNLVDRARLERA